MADCGLRIAGCRLQIGNGDKEQDKWDQDQGRGLGQQGQTGEKAGEGPPDDAARFLQPVESGHQGEEAKGRQQRVGVEEAGVTDEKRVEGQQADCQQCHTPVEKTHEQRVECSQAQRGGQRDGDATVGEEESQVMEGLPVLRGQPDQAADPIQVGDAFEGIQQPLHRQSGSPQPHRCHPWVACGRDCCPVAGQQRVGQADGAVDPGWLVGGHVPFEGGQTEEKAQDDK